MLKRIAKSNRRRVECRIAIVASRYNRRYVDAMVGAASRTIKGAGGNVDIVRVPGAFEIPAVAAKLAADCGYDALICLGVILRGATVHAEHIGHAVTGALAGLQTEHRLPVIHEVLLLENQAQARERCLDRHHNRGVEAAQTALEMVDVMRRLSRPND
jgi:6,7-dimethyl-8-ribityllumazine synthase